ncbi:uncharacterized protein FIBRA_04218 [Fibroporia radiculosa]|uniref:Uncharacterized protein n=1 Tax=Fibroporia radiculosa TaxID=599839 RepID=J4IA19_9APHY|nr:uncharacterized protein FIBRA_04218 [Fibroporia radiculosa]CCM02141.1 predicted protein [Fibroporia radiculosa]
MYDYSPSPSSASQPPSPHKPHHLQPHRSHSPMSHISTLLPHNHHQSQYSPATRAADISRLLDPVYASGSSSSGSSTYPSAPHHNKRGQTRAYVDRNGDLHDPDYRDFPVYAPSARTTAGRRRRASNGMPRSRSHSRQRDRYPSYSMARPEWERDWSTEVEDEEEDDLVDDDSESQSHYSPFASHAVPRRSSTVHSASAYVPYTSYSPYYSEPQPLASSPVGSYEEDQSPQLCDSPLQESPFLSDEMDSSPHADRKKSRRASGHSNILRRTSKKHESSARSSGFDGDSEKSGDGRSPQQQFSVAGDHSDNVPSCSASLRQQWAATVLYIRFGLFHAKQRLRRRSDAS